jgi:hypothetical protein
VNEGAESELSGLQGAGRPVFLPGVLGKRKRAAANSGQVFPTHMSRPVPAWAQSRRPDPPFPVFGCHGGIQPSPHCFAFPVAVRTSSPSHLGSTRHGGAPPLLPTPACPGGAHPYFRPSRLFVFIPLLPACGGGAQGPPEVTNLKNCGVGLSHSHPRFQLS